MGYLDGDDTMADVSADVLPYPACSIICPDPDQFGFFPAVRSGAVVVVAI